LTFVPQSAADAEMQALGQKLEDLKAQEVGVWGGGWWQIGVELCYVLVCFV